MGTKKLLITTLTAIWCSLLLFQQGHCATYNITEVLENYPDYSSFNDILTRTKLADYINSNQETITLLVTKDVGALSGKSLPTTEAILSLHVVLDYMDKTKIMNMKRTVAFTTLFQRTGIAQGSQGFVNFTRTDDGGNNDIQIMVGNGRRDAQLSVKVQKLVMTQQPVLSILEVSGLIQAPWADNVKAPSPRSHKKAPISSPESAPSPSPRRHRKAAPPSEEEPSSPPEPEEDYVADADASTPTPTPAPAAKKSSAHRSFVFGGAATSLLLGLMVSLVA